MANISRMNLSGQSYQILLIESQIFPPVETLAHAIRYRTILFEVKENYQKRSFRNRYRIGSHSGLHELSVPLIKGKNNQMPVTDVRISYDSNWPRIHWKALQTSYGNSAYFIHYKDLVRDVIESECTYLLELNMLSWKLIREVYQMEWKFLITDEYKSLYDETVLDLRNKINFRTLESHINPEYYQVFSTSTGFIPQLSILDVIFHLGPDGLMYLSALKTS
jgi:hypothetical protein